MIKPVCDFKISEDCEGELKHYGGLVVGPPDKKGKCKKLHICINCYKILNISKKCKGVLKHYGGFVVGPPDENGMCDNIPICTNCYKTFEDDYLKNKKS